MKKPNKDMDVEAIVEVASMLSWYWHDKLGLRKEQSEPSARTINFFAYLRVVLGVYCLRYALVPVGILSVHGHRRVKGGFHVWRCRQFHIFGVRVARWVVGEVLFHPDPKPELEVGEPEAGEVAEEELVGQLGQPACRAMKNGKQCDSLSKHAAAHRAEGCKFYEPDSWDGPIKRRIF